jgi:hypothetical protein
VVPGRREITASHVLALFQTHGLGEVAFTPVDSLTAQSAWSKPVSASRCFPKATPPRS